MSGHSSGQPLPPKRLKQTFLSFESTANRTRSITGKFVKVTIKLS